MAENCEKCKFRAHYDNKPNSFLGKFWRWHINFCPGWKGYFTSQSDEKKAELRAKYNFNKYQVMGHGHLWLFNMDMCCSMQISSLIEKLRDCKRMGRTTSCVVSPNYPAASNEDYLFDCMNLYARLGDDGTVELSGTVFYWDPKDGDTQKSVIIQTFPDLDACLEWLGNESAACDKCVELLNENC